jgi:putative sterol carrier protein
MPAEATGPGTQDEPAARGPEIRREPEAIDPQALDSAELARLADELDAATLQGLLAGLDGAELGQLVRAAGPETAKRLLKKIGPSAFDLASIDPADVDPELFDTELMALLFKLTPDERLAAAMAGPMRDVIVDEVFRRMPERLNRRAAAGLDETIAWRIGRPDGGYDRYLVRIADGACTVERDGDGEARASLQMDSLTFCKVVTGNANPVMQFMTGKLSVRGDLMFAATVTRLFDIPKPR